LVSLAIEFLLAGVKGFLMPQEDAGPPEIHLYKHWQELAWLLQPAGSRKTHILVFTTAAFQIIFIKKQSQVAPGEV